MDYLDEADIVKIPKIKGIKYIKSGDGIYNPYVIHNGQKYRPRVETLIFNDKEQIFLNNNGVPNKYGTTYILTGGGIDKGKKLEDQAAAECKEEARIIIKNITYTGITYISPYHGMYPSWQKEKLWPYGLKYEGAITYVFVAEYDKKYNGYVAPVDSVDNMWTVGKWYNPEDLPLRKEHKQAVKFYNKNIDIISDSYIETENILNKALQEGNNECVYEYNNEEQKNIEYDSNKFLDFIQEDKDITYKDLSHKFKDFDDLCNRFDRPEDVFEWMKVINIKWPNSSRNTTSPKVIWPDKLIKTTYGICFDQSLFIHYFCERKGIENRILMLSISFATSILSIPVIGMGHAMPMFKSEEGWYVINYQTMTSPVFPSNLIGPYKTEEEAVKFAGERFRKAITTSKNITILKTKLAKIFPELALSSIKEAFCQYAAQDPLEYKYYNNYYNKSYTQEEIIGGYNGPIMKSIVKVLVPRENYKKTIDILKERKKEKEEGKASILELPFKYIPMDIINNYIIKEDYIEENTYNMYSKQYKNFDEFCNAMDNPYDVLKWYDVNKVNWGDKKNGVEPFHWPDDIIKTHEGNCYDHAIFMHYFCDRKGIENELLTIELDVNLEGVEYTCRFGHIVSVFKYREGWYVFDYRDPRIHPSSNMYGPFKNKDILKSNYEKAYKERVLVDLTALNKKYSASKLYCTYQDKSEFKYYDRFYGDTKIPRYVFSNTYCKSWFVKERTLKEKTKMESLTYLILHSGKTIIDKIRSIIDIPFKEEENISKELLQTNDTDSIITEIYNSLDSAQLYLDEVSKEYNVYDNLGVKNKFKSFFNRNKYKNESTGLAGIGGVVGTMQPFITQYGPNATFTKNDKDNIEGYALSNDIITKNVLIVDKDGKVKKKDSSFLEGRKIRMFKYIGEDTTTLEDINKIIGKYGYREIFYEILSNKKLLSDDQILCDECFEEVSLSEIHEEKVSAIQTLIDGIKFITGEEVNKLPLMNESDIIKANDIIDDNQNIEIFENEYGYFAENVLTHKRTGYYKSINKIQIKPIII